MSSGNMQSFLPQQSWQQGNSTKSEASPAPRGSAPFRTPSLTNAEMILKRIDERWPAETVSEPRG